MPRMVLMVSAPLVTELDGGLKVPVPLDLQAEVDAVQDACDRRKVAVDIEVKIATEHSLGEFLATQSEPVDILHFCGHGTQQGGLVLEDEQGKTRFLKPEDLKDLLRPYAVRQQPPCRLALLNACHSEVMAQVLLDQGVPHVVVVSADDRILDIASRVFAERFYPALLTVGQSVQAAFEAAKAAVEQTDLLGQYRERVWEPGNDLEAAKFELLP